MRYTGDIIRIAREFTGNQEYERDATSGAMKEGISQDLCVLMLNDADEYLHVAILNKYPQMFASEEIISVVASQEAYTPTNKIFLNNKFRSVEYSIDGQVRHYSPLPQKTLIERQTFSKAHPDFYIRRSGQILLNPIPQSSGGSFRINYYSQNPTLDIRRGKIKALDAVPTTEIELENDSDLDSVGLGREEKICIVDRFGVQQDTGITISSYDATTRKITITSTTLTGGVADYIVFGEYSSTHSSLNGLCEKYLRTYLQKRLYNTDSSVDSIEESKELLSLEKNILSAYEEISEDITEIPILDPQLQ